MLYVVCLAFAAAVVAVAAVFASLVRALIRQQARERGLLIDQILHATGRPWQPAPADTPPLETDESDPEAWPAWSATPEQDPVY